MEVSSRLLPADVLRVGSIGLRTRRLRATLSALGIAIGIASMVAVLRISQSSKADLLAQLDELGTNLLTITPGESLLGEAASLPGTAPKMVGRLDPVEQVATERMTDKTVRRTNYIPAAQTNGISVGAADTNLLATLNGTVKTRVFLNDANIRYPAIVLRSVAAERLAIGSLEAGPMVYVNGRWSASSESSTRSRSTANPANPEEVAVSRPSDVLEARAAAETAYTSLFLGLGAVALLVGGVGIANVMVISVLERRSEIGLRRALGAAKRHISVQFLSESLLLAALGGLAGALIGMLVTAGYALARGWRSASPPTPRSAGSPRHS
jgi:putative ABC transport system permease protein